MATLKDTIRSSVTNHNIPLIARIAEQSRTGINGVRFDYNSLCNLFTRCAGIDDYEFEGLMQEVDEWEAGN